MAVTAAERQQARLCDVDRSRVDRLGVIAAARVGFRARRAAMAAAARGGNAAQVFKTELSAAVPILTATMMSAHLTGRRRTALTLARSGLVLKRTPYEEALDWLVKRLNLSPAEVADLEHLYQADALRVIQKTSSLIESELEAAILQSVQSGEHVREGLKPLREVFDRNGLTPDNAFTLESLFRTQTAIAYGAGRWNADQDPVVQEILWGYKYVTVGDDRVRPAHVGFDGTTLPKDDPFWRTNFPPNGWCCRCVAISIFEQRELARPRPTEVDGVVVTPEADDGFQFNPGLVRLDSVREL